MYNKKKGSLYLYNIGQLVTMAGGPRKGASAMGNIGVIEGPAVLVIEDGVITFAGEQRNGPCPKEEGMEYIDVGGMCVVPGFVDSHTHLVFGGYREEEFQWRLAGESYMSIMERGGGIASTTKATRAASFEELVQQATKHLDAMFRMGVTTVEAKSGYGMDKETEIRQLEVTQYLNNTHPISLYSTYMGAHDTPKEYAGRPHEYIDFIINEMLPLVKEKGLAKCVDIFTEKNVFEHEDTRKLLNAAKRLGFQVKMHADEIVPFGGAELAAELGCLSADHLLKISPEGIAALAASDTVATCLPLTAFSLMDDYAPARQMIDAGCCVAIASDLNPGSCFSASIPLLIALSTIYAKMSIEETLAALTINAAKAIDQEHTIGSLEVGKAGDAVILKYPSYKFLSYHFGMNLVDTTIKSGITYKF